MKLFSDDAPDIGKAIVIGVAQVKTAKSALCGGGMACIKWSPALATGIERIDRDHLNLLARVNELHSALRVDGSSARDIHAVFMWLRRETVQHFAAEEELMVRHGYPEAARHMAQHGELITDLVRLTERQTQAHGVVSQEELEHLACWLVNHIEGPDGALGAFLREKQGQVA